MQSKERFVDVTTAAFLGYLDLILGASLCGSTRLVLLYSQNAQDPSCPSSATHVGIRW